MGMQTSHALSGIQTHDLSTCPSHGSHQTTDTKTYFVPVSYYVVI